MGEEDEGSAGEQRFRKIGMDFLGRLLVVIYTYRGENIRLISARKATKKEAGQYYA
ncbi:MAG: BrnT family toxin [Desulfobaccales bacterium]